ncbi:hypothetical protein NIES2119_19560 [[Phormidium ambiguum] IAM M-71]|uniref:Trypsin-co-occurring domain-containing protein n=1 Tax=[Phormidium ambiguum] IAM M-71 TaxID=454136 RepID=A0A1U7IFF6_9CYAN|nr:CU044_2847 family protein [Phormidium ambiguum]OKH35696.1 hypothetical protein NIES2119_19560 [Phormidium ambiguum IAM M-71]
MKQLAEFVVAGEVILVEVDEPESNVVERAALPSGQKVLKAQQSLEEAFDKVKPVANAIISKLKDLNTPADEVEVKFGIKLTADAGAIFTSIGGEVNYEITLKWSNNKSN